MRFSLGSILSLAIVLSGWAMVASEEVGIPDNIRELKNNSRPKVKIVGNNGGHGFPLGLCQGDCDNDADCAGHLVCHERRANEPVPGCRGGHADTSEADYCVDRRNVADPGAGNTEHETEHPGHENEDNDHENKPATTPSGPFYLKLHWREGFDWDQGKWCMKCHRGRCRENKEMYIESCRRRSSFFSRGPTRLEFNNLGDSVQVKIAAPHFSLYRLCLERRDLEVRVEKCDESNPLQRWVSPRGRTNGNRFELAPHTDDSLCMTQRHHPKRNEKVRLEPCKTARGDQTSLWTRYYP